MSLSFSLLLGKIESLLGWLGILSKIMQAKHLAHNKNSIRAIIIIIGGNSSSSSTTTIIIYSIPSTCPCGC